MKKNLMEVKPMHSHLSAWFQDNPSADAYFGRVFAVRSDALAYFLTGKPLQREIAARHGVSRTTVTMAVGRAKKMFGQGQSI